MNGQPVSAEQDIKSSTVKLNDEQRRSTEGDSNQGRLPEGFIDGFVGTTFLNFKILRVIGRGAMGTVYQAEHLLLEKNVAIKVLHPHLCSDVHALKRFTQEARSASKLHHKGIIAVHDFGVMPDGRPYLSMDYIDGINLSDVIGRRPLAPERALTICSLICDALAEAHEKGVIHRDVKPSNVLVLNHGTAEEDIKVVDFGIAKILEDPKHNALTQTGESLGSPPYMSPEQCQARPLDARSDIYSLGCVLYEMLTGFAPYQSDSVYEIIHKHLNSYPESIAKSQPSLPNAVELDALLLQALAKDPPRRYQTVGAMKQALENAKHSASSGYAVADRAKAWYSLLLNRYITKRSAVMVLLVVSIAVPCALTFHLTSRPQNPAPTAQDSKEGFTIGPNFYALQRDGHGELAKRNWLGAEQKFLGAMESGKWLGEENHSYQDCMTGLATAQEMQGKTVPAATLRARLALLERFAGDSGDILSNSGKLAQLTTQRAKSPHDAKLRDELLALLANQSVLYWTERDNANARMCADSAIDIAESEGLMSHPSALRALGILSRAHSDNYEFVQAKKGLDKLLSFAQQHPDSPLLADAYDCLGRYFYRRSSCLELKLSAEGRESYGQQALSYYAKAKQIWTATYGPSSPWLADNLVDTAVTLRSLEQFDAAAENCREAYVMDGKIRGMQDPRTGRAYYHYGQIQIFWTTVKPSLAADRDRHMHEAEQALDIAETILAKGSPAQAETLLSVIALRAKTFEYFKNYAAAEHNYERAFTDSLRLAPTGDAAKYSYNGLMRIYKIQNRQQDIDTLMSSVRERDTRPNPQLNMPKK